MALLYFVDTIIHYIRHKSKHFNPHFFKTTNQSLTELPTTIAADGSQQNEWRLIPFNITITTINNCLAQGAIDISKSVNYKNGRCVAQITLQNNGNYINQTSTSVSFEIKDGKFYVYAFNKNNDWTTGLSCTASVLVFCEKL